MRFNSKMNTRSAAICLFCFIFATIAPTIARAETRTQNFDADPNWEGINNHIIPQRRIQQ